MEAKPFFSCLLRLVLSLPFLVKVLPLCLVLIFISSMAPVFFRLYLGWFAGCSGGVECETTVAGFQLSLSAWGLLGIALAATLLRIISWLTFELSGQWASQAIHREAVRALGRTRISFFEESSVGSIVSRLVSDFYDVALLATIRIGDSINVIFDLIAISIVVGYGSPLCSVLLIPLICLVIKVQRRDMQLIHSARQGASVAYGDFLGRLPDLLEGRDEFVRHSKQPSLLHRIFEGYETHVVAETQAGEVEAFNRLRIQSIAELYGVLVLTVLAIGVSSGSLQAVEVGVIISVVFGMSASFAMLTMATSSMEDSLATSSRLLELTELPAEEEVEDRRSVKVVTASRPTDGDISLVDLEVSYSSNGERILDGITALLPQGKRIAIIGRTGSGKSTLIQALTRMVEVQRGDIRIGGRSIYEESTATTRSRFALVPQVPYLFAGTLRDNIDRLRLIDEDRLRRTLECVGLKYAPDFIVEDGGAPLSMGERQLVSFARAALTDRAFVLLDEPTSLLDPELDCRLQELTKQLFKGRTVLCVAHRLDSVADYDLVLWIDKGSLVEIGEPAAILKRFQQRVA